MKTYIYTDPDQHDVVPYVTSYYSEVGFLYVQVDKDSLPSGKYKVLIDSTLEDGYLKLSQMYLNGSCSSEIFFSSYVYTRRCLIMNSVALWF